MARTTSPSRAARAARCAPRPIFTGAPSSVATAASRIRFTNFSIDGNRAALEKPLPFAPSDKTFASVFADNGILIEDSDGLAVDHVDFAEHRQFRRDRQPFQNMLRSIMSR